MKRFSAITMAILCTIVANAQIDTLSTQEKVYELQGVVVEADLAVTSAEGSKYYPSRKQKNVAADATSLLQHMMIPQLQVDPMTQAVKTITNESVSIFIDYMPATQEDLDGMRTQDVKRVEIYDFPKDVRFQNKKHVVNFVMQKYEWGGYTKLSTTDMLMSGKDYQAGGSAYTKFARKNWTFDSNLSDTYTKYGHVGAETTTIYELPEQTITRKELSENGNSRIHKPSASLRATYNKDNVQLANRFEVLYDNKPERDLFGTVNYSPSIFNSSNSESHSSSSSITPAYQGNWYFALPKDWMLSASPEYFYMRNNVNRFYREGEMQPIKNDIKEDASYLTWQIGLSKTFAEKHTISLTNYGIDYYSKMDYSGSTISKSSMNMFAAGVGIGYNFAIEKFDFSADIAYGYSYNNMNGMVQKDHYPVGNILAAYSPNSKHSLTMQFSLGQQGADAAKRNANVLQENELLYYSGNPLMEDYDMELFALQYTWMPSNLFSASAYAQTILSNNYFANTYQLYNNGTALIRKMENVGNLCESDFGASMTLRLLEGKLQLNASPSLNLYSIRGEYERQRTLFNFTSWASYYFGNYYLQAYFRTSERAYDKTENAWSISRPYFYLRAGWGNAKWKGNVTLSNPFLTDWRGSQTEIITPLFSKTAAAFNSSSHQSLTITVSYTFNYGKKVKHGNELKAATGGKSSIL